MGGAGGAGGPGQRPAGARVERADNAGKRNTRDKQEA